MGNVSTTRRKTVSKELEKYCKPTGLYETCPWEERVVRRWIMDGHVAPRFPGADAPSYAGSTGVAAGELGPVGLEAAATAAAAGMSGGRSTLGVGGSTGAAAERLQTEECPICFMHYQGVNRTVCCSKPLCTECYLQVRPPRSSVVCPFCNCAKFNVAYLGPPSKEETDKRMAEEQRTIEARIRAEQEELMRQAKERTARANSESAATGASSPDAAEGAGASVGEGARSERGAAMADSPALSSLPGSSSSSAPARASLATVAERRRTEERIRNQNQQVSTPTSAGAGASSSFEHPLQRRRQYRARNSRIPRRPSLGMNDEDSGGEYQDHSSGLGVEQGEIQQVEDLMLMEALRLSILEEQARRERSGDMYRRQAAVAAAAVNAGGGGGASSQASQQQGPVPPTVPASLSARLTSAYLDQRGIPPPQRPAASSAVDTISAGTGITGIPSWWETADASSVSARAAAAEGNVASSAINPDDSMVASFWQLTPGTSGPSVAEGGGGSRTAGEALSAQASAVPTDHLTCGTDDAESSRTPAVTTEGGPVGRGGLVLAAAAARYCELMANRGSDFREDAASEGDCGLPAAVAVAARYSEETRGDASSGCETSGAKGPPAEHGATAGSTAGRTESEGGAGYPAELPESEEDQLRLAIELSLRSAGSTTGSGGEAASGRSSSSRNDADVAGTAAAIAAVAATESPASPFSSLAEGALDAFVFSAGASAAAQAGTRPADSKTSPVRSSSAFATAISRDPPAEEVAGGETPARAGGAAASPGNFSSPFAAALSRDETRRIQPPVVRDATLGVGDNWYSDAAMAFMNPGGTLDERGRIVSEASADATGVGAREVHRMLPPEDRMGIVARERYESLRDFSKPSLFVSKFPAPPVPGETFRARTTANEEQGKCGVEEDERKPPAPLAQTARSLGASNALPVFSAPAGNPSTSGRGFGGGHVNPDAGGGACAVGSNVSSEQNPGRAQAAAVGGRMEAASASDTAPAPAAERNAGFDDEAKREQESVGTSVLNPPSAEPGESVPASIAFENGSSVIDDSRMPAALGADGDDLAGTAAAAAVPRIPSESRIGTIGDVYPEPHAAGEDFKNTQEVENATGTTTRPAHDDDLAEVNPIDTEIVASAEPAAEGTGGEVSNLSDFIGGWVVSNSFASTAETDVLDTAATGSSSSVATAPNVAAIAESGDSARGAGGSIGRVGEQSHPADAPDGIQDGTVRDVVDDLVMECDAVAGAATDAGEETETAAAGSEDNHETIP